ncbi:hypothetical protein FRC14_008098 [Serendipita sp. 396]|nr:hypothetical protein FRC14_008098 [Serendipita sp. 396]
MVVERSLMLKTWSRVAQRARRNPYAGAGRIAQRGERRGELSSSCFVFVINTELLDMAQPGSSGQPSDLGSYAAYNSQLATNHVQQSAQQLENTNSSVHPYVFASAAHRQSSNPPAPAQSPPSSTQANMMGSSLPWNPNNNPLPDYPSPDALAAGYQAFLDTYTTPTTNTTNKGGQDNPAKSSFQSHSIGFHEGNDFEPRNSTSKPIGYSQHQYAPSDGYPPSNAMAHPHPHISTSGSNVQQKDGHGHARHQHQQPPQRQSTSSGDMFALSPESLSSSHDSPQLFGHGLTTSPPMHHQPHQYFSPDSQQYYAQQAYSDPHWQPAQHPQTASSHDTFHFQPHFLQQQHQQQQQQQHQQQSTYAPHAPPPGGNSNYGQGGGAPSYSPYPGSSTGGVAPHQINPGGSSANSANVGSNQPPINRQGRPMIPPRKAASQQPINLKAPTNPPQQATYVQKMNSQPNLAKGLALVAPVTKRKKLNEPEESSSEEEDEEYMELGTQPQQQGNNGGNKPSARLPGACAPCKRLKMRCVFPDGEKVCQRCRNSGRGNLCVVGPRKPRQPSNKKELLLQKLQERDSLIKSKDVVIQSLLEQLQNPHVQISLKDGPQGRRRRRPPLALLLVTSRIAPQNDLLLIPLSSHGSRMQKPVSRARQGIVSRMHGA